MDIHISERVLFWILVWTNAMLILNVILHFAGSSIVEIIQDAWYVITGRQI